MESDTGSNSRADHPRGLNGRAGSGGYSHDVVRPRSLLPALVAVSASLALLPPAAAQYDDGHPRAPRATAAPVQQPVQQAARQLADQVGDDPLAITIESLTPSVIPERGRVTITGTVTNASDETWSGINVYPLTSTAFPMTTVDELDAAARADDDLVVGERIIAISDQIAVLAPGQAASYTLRVPRSYLGDTEGVHWLGVHALAQNDEGRDDIADGKARTFLPLVGPNRTPIETALVLPLRRRIDHSVDGRIAQPERWAADLATGGRLRGLVELGVSAGGRPITWLLDPAVLASVNALVAGNPSRLPPPPEPEEPGETEEPEPEEPGPTELGITADPTDPAAVAAAATAGQAWLARLQAALAGQELLTLPYGDVDASAASRLRPGLLRDAHTTSATMMAAMGLVGTPAIGSPSGFMNQAAIAGSDPATTVLVTDAAVATDAPPLASIGGREVVLTSSTAVEGGPGPDDPYATIAVRQRILSEAAVRLLSRGREPLVVAIPTDWTPIDTGEFFPGLDVDWLELGHLSDVTDRTAETVDAEDYVYPAFQENFELDNGTFAAAEELEAAGTTMQQVLTSNATVGDAVGREASTLTAYWQRPRPNAARVAGDRSRAWIETTLGRVTVEGPPSVTLSSDTGQFPATVSNGLDEPVVVRVDAVPSDGLTVDTPEPVELDPGESTRLRLSATTEAIGAHTVRLVVASVDGDLLGSSDELPIRSNQVSQIIWIFIVAGGGLLLGAIAVRLFRRIRRARQPETA